MLPTNDPLTQGIAWGVAATFGPAVPAGIAFGVAAAITAIFVPVATFVFPIVLVGKPLIAFGAELYDRKMAKEYVEHGMTYDDGSVLNLDHFSWDTVSDEALNEYQRKGLEMMSSSKEDKAAWMANGDRNRFGFFRVPFIGLGVLAAVITLSAVEPLLPAVLFSTAVTAFIPGAFVALGIIALLAAGAYMYVNKNTQLDNQYKLAVGMEPGSDAELYLDRDLDLVQEYEKSLEKSVDKTVSSEPSAKVEDPGHFPSPLKTGEKLEPVPTSDSELTKKIST
jgi:hypothetical protein